jgi:hypothetical protein
MLTPAQTAASIFLSHTHVDNSFVKRLADDLREAGATVWVDEAEMQVGDSLIEKIRSGIDAMDYLAVVLSPDSVASSWVRREVDIAMNQEIEGKKIKVLPVLYRRCDLPGFLKGKMYADFTDPENYGQALALLLRRLKLSLPAQESTTRYDPYPFTDAAPSLRDLPSDARDLLLRGADDEGQVIATHWSGRSETRLASISTTRWKIVTEGPDHEALRWTTALGILAKRGLIQEVGSRPGYRAYKVTPKGWDAAMFVRQVITKPRR